MEMKIKTPRYTQEVSPTLLPHSNIQKYSKSSVEVQKQGIISIPSFSPSWGDFGPEIRVVINTIPVLRLTYSNSWLIIRSSRSCLRSSRDGIHTSRDDQSRPDDVKRMGCYSWVIVSFVLPYNLLILCWSICSSCLLSLFALCKSNLQIVF